jgi:hypothetical protein
MSLFQQTRVGTFEWNIKTGVNRWSPELETTYGLPKGGFQGTLSAAREQLVLAEREGFEPPIPVKVYTLSRRAPSATRPSLRVASFHFIRQVVGSNR